MSGGSESYAGPKGNAGSGKVKPLSLSGGATARVDAGLPLRTEATNAAERKGVAALWRHTAAAQKRTKPTPQAESVRLERHPVSVPALLLSYHSCKLGRNSLWKIQHPRCCKTASEDPIQFRVRIVIPSTVVLCFMRLQLALGKTLALRFTLGNKTTACEVKTQRQFRRPGDSNSCANNHRATVLSECSYGRVIGDKEWRFATTKVHTVQHTLDIHRLAKLGGPVCQMIRAAHRPVFLHQLRPETCFKSPDQHRFCRPGRSANRVHAKMVPVDQIHISMPRRPKHDSVASRHARSGMAGRIILEVGLGFNDGPTAQTIRRAPKQPVAQQSRRYHPRRRMKKGSRQWREFLHAQDR